MSFAISSRRRHQRRIARRHNHDSNALPIDDEEDRIGLRGKDDDADENTNEHVGKWQNIRQAFVARDYEPFIIALLPFPRTPDSNISHAE